MAGEGDCTRMWPAGCEKRLAAVADIKDDANMAVDKAGSVADTASIVAAATTENGKCMDGDVAAGTAAEAGQAACHMEAAAEAAAPRIYERGAAAAETAKADETGETERAGVLAETASERESDGAEEMRAAAEDVAAGIGVSDMEGGAAGEIRAAAAATAERPESVTCATDETERAGAAGTAAADADTLVGTQLMLPICEREAAGQTESVVRAADEAERAEALAAPALWELLGEAVACLTQRIQRHRTCSNQADALLGRFSQSPDTCTDAAQQTLRELRSELLDTTQLLKAVETLTKCALSIQGADAGRTAARSAGPTTSAQARRVVVTLDRELKKWAQ